MKWTLLSTLLLSFSLYASPLIDEQLYVFGPVEQVKALVESGSVIVDHVEENGFELYGPQGLSEYLEKEGITFYKEEPLEKTAND